MLGGQPEPLEPLDLHDVLDLHDQLCKAARNIVEAKNHDYCGEGGCSPFANFQRSESLGICDARLGILMRLTDKLSRLVTYVQAGRLKVPNEAWNDAVIDSINYLVLFAGMEHERQGTRWSGSKSNGSTPTTNRAG